MRSKIIKMDKDGGTQGKMKSTVVGSQYHETRVSSRTKKKVKTG